MSWELRFYRRVGQSPLIREEVTPVFSRLPRFEQQELEPTPGEFRARYVYLNPISGVTFRFDFVEPDEEPEGEDPGVVDFPYELTGLTMTVEYPSAPEAAQEAAPIAVEICQMLDLLVQPPQMDQLEPRKPDAAALIESYLSWCGAIDEVIVHLKKRKRQHLSVGCVAVAAAMAIFLYMFLTGRG